MAGIRKALDHLMLLRPTVLMPGWTMTLLGAYQGYAPPFFWFHFPPSLYWTLLAYTALMGAVYILNQLTDAETDALNDKLYLIAQGYVSPRAAALEAGGLALGGYLVAWMLGPASLVYRGLMLLSGALGVAYSTRPIRLKGRPLLDLLANAVGYGAVAYMVGWVAVASPTQSMFRLVLPYPFCVGAAFVLSTLLDAEGDRRGGDRTTGVVLGVRPACGLSFVLILAACLASLWVGNPISLLASGLSLPLYTYTLFRHSLGAIVAVMRVSVALLSLITALLMPYYGIILIGIIFGVRAYYRRRLDVRYPF